MQLLPSTLRTDGRCSRARTGIHILKTGYCRVSTVRTAAQGPADGSDARAFRGTSIKRRLDHFPSFGPNLARVSIGVVPHRRGDARGGARTMGGAQGEAQELSDLQAMFASNGGSPSTQRETSLPVTRIAKLQVSELNHDMAQKVRTQPHGPLTPPPQRLLERPTHATPTKGPPSRFCTHAGPERKALPRETTRGGGGGATQARA